MRNRDTATSWLVGLLLLASPALGQNYEQIAKQIVNTSAGVKPGDAVVITGGQFTMPLMEAVAVEVARAGGQPMMWVTTDKVARAVNMETPEAAIQASKSSPMLLQADVLITLPGLEDGHRGGRWEGAGAQRPARGAGGNGQGCFRGQEGAEVS